MKGRAQFRLTALEIGVVVGLVVYGCLCFLPPVARMELLGVTLNAWGGLSLLIIAPVLGMLVVFRGAVSEDDSPSGRRKE